MNDKPWYQNGLEFQCTGCGDCCTGAEGYVWINREEVEAMARLLGIDDRTQFERKHTRLVGIRRSLLEYANGDCVFFDGKSRTCKVYDARPRQCRSWPFWGSNVRTPAAWALVAKSCPGCGQGRLRTFEEIEQQREIINI